jgi:hypothetical protein
MAPLAQVAAQEMGIVVAEARLPASGSAYRGGTHAFPGGVRLTCGSHGGFTSSVAPPAGPGQTAIADYRATFVGELALPTTSAAGPIVHRIEAPVHMVERITFGERRGDAQVLETELVALDLSGGGLPSGVLVRESPRLGSLGRATVTALERGRSRIESVYDVWLELSTDGGRSWSRAEAAVRMTLAPEVAARAIRGGN